jgi:ubiquinone/menaquinone biosynthesis C-methylase UbiE
LSTIRKQHLKTLEAQYLDRERRSAGNDTYSPFNRAGLFALQKRQRAVLQLFGDLGLTSLSGKRVLEVGCGTGTVLLELLGYKSDPENLCGVDLLFHRVAGARKRLTHLPLACADGQNLPYQSGSFDLVLQFTVFSSILEKPIRENLASEMLRVLNRTRGVIIWYDFWTNPVNRQTIGIRKQEIRGLFPGCTFTFRRVTLAPPFTRKIVPLSWPLASALEGLGVFNTHYLVAIRCQG